MLIVFNGATPIQRRVLAAVVDDNESKELVLRLERHQDLVDLAVMTCFAKIQSDDHINKIRLADIQVYDQHIDVHWTLGRNVTSYERSLAQLQFEGRDGDVVWQTEALAIVMGRTIPADEYIENEYPSILQDHERRIIVLEEFKDSAGETFETKMEAQEEHAAIRDSIDQISQSVSDHESRIENHEDRITTLENSALDPDDYYTKTQTDTLLNGKQNVLTWDQTPTQGSTNPVTSGGVYLSYRQAMDIAEGKTKAFSVDPETPGNEALTSDADNIVCASFVDVDGNTIQTSQLRKGDMIFTLNSATHKYKDRWLSSPATQTWGMIDADSPSLENYYTKLAINAFLAEKLSLSFAGAQPYDATATYAVGATCTHDGKLYKRNTATSTPEEWDATHWTEVTLNDYVDLGSDQKIDGTKTVERINFHSSKNYIIYDSQCIKIFTNNKEAWRINPLTQTWTSHSIIPMEDNKNDLGNSTHRLKDVYIGGYLTNGSSSVSVQSIATQAMLPTFTATGIYIYI